MSHQYFEIEAELRKAVQGRHYEDLPRLMAGYGTAAASEAGALAKNGDELAAFAGHVSEVLQWSRLMILATRSSIAAEINRTNSVSRYLAPSESPASALRCEG